MELAEVVIHEPGFIRTGRQTGIYAVIPLRGLDKLRRCLTDLLTNPSALLSDLYSLVQRQAIDGSGVLRPQLP